jgi:hypothetical protein
MCITAPGVLAGTADSFRGPRRRAADAPTPGGQGLPEGRNDARTGIPTRMLIGAMCVQRFDDSLNSAIHITYRISLRSSSMPKPRDPLLKVLIEFCIVTQKAAEDKELKCWGLWRAPPCVREAAGPALGLPAEATFEVGSQRVGESFNSFCNDPSAGSPTETLLRLLLPLNDRVWITFRP